jgi:hypothetical protein
MPRGEWRVCLRARARASSCSRDRGGRLMLYRSKISGVITPASINSFSAFGIKSSPEEPSFAGFDTAYGSQSIPYPQHVPFNSNNAVASGSTSRPSSMIKGDKKGGKRKVGDGAESVGRYGQPERNLSNPSYEEVVDALEWVDHSAGMGRVANATGRIRCRSLLSRPRTRLSGQKWR